MGTPNALIPETFAKAESIGLSTYRPHDIAPVVIMEAKKC